MRIVAQHLAVFASAWLGLVGIDHEVVRTFADLLRHERPLQACRKACAAAAALPRGFHLVDDAVAAFFQYRLGAVPGAARPRSLEAPVALAVKIFKNAVL